VTDFTLSSDFGFCCVDPLETTRLTGAISPGWVLCEFSQVGAFFRESMVE
jgi:hypothetical protein